MTKQIAISNSEIEKLKNRVKKSAQEKSYLQLVYVLLDRMNEAQGLEYTIEKMLAGISDLIGGTNICLYYWLAKKTIKIDVFGKQEVIEKIDDKIVRQAIETREFVEFESHYTDTKMKTSEISGAFTWCFPLLAGEELIGVIKAENLHGSMKPFLQYLQTFFDTAALVLKNEIFGYTQLKKAFDELSEEVVARRQAQKALHESKQSLWATLKSIGDAVIACDCEGNVTSLNNVAEELTGWTNLEAKGKTIEEVFHIVHADSREKTENPVRRSLAEGLIVELANHTVLINRDGRELQIADSCAPIRNEEKEVVGAVLVFRDVTNEYLRKQELFIRERAIESSINAFVLADLDYGIKYVNPEFVRLCGFKDVKVVAGRNLTEFFHNQEKANSMLYALKTSGAWRSEMVLDMPTGQLEVDLAASLVRDEEGKPLCVQLSFSDISGKNKAEREQEKLQTQLNQAQKMESVGRLAGGVAHDFNNMLGVILGHSEMALKKIDAAHPAYDNLLQIQHAAERSAALTRQLLAFARKQAILPKVVNLGNVIEGMIKMLRRLIGESIQLVFKPEDHLWEILVDPAQIDQILANLCVNARDAIDENGRIIIEARNKNVDEDFSSSHPDAMPGQYVMLSVSDNGCGMNAEVLSRLFEPFFTTKDLGEGTGLGLATIYGIVKQNNGFINVYSEPGEGTDFKIYFPRYKGEGKSENEVEHAPEFETGDETILLVEDELSLLRMTSLMLKSHGYKVLAAVNHKEAMRLAKENADTIKLLIADVIMPEVNGQELSKRISALYPGIKIVFMSGYTADVISKKGILEDKVNFIQKPFTSNELVKVIKKTLRN